jgi:hypothetical protein
MVVSGWVGCASTSIVILRSEVFWIQKKCDFVKLLLSYSKCSQWIVSPEEVWLYKFNLS